MDPCQRKTSHDWEEPLQIFDDHYNSFIELPPHNPAHPKRRAIVMDCEMVGIPHNLSEVARICVVDYLTGDVLIDCFVDPVEQVHDWRSRFSGITKENMAEAKYDKNCFPNWRAARAAVLQFVDANTTLIGTALQNDLKILRLVHSKIVDCGILAQQKVGSPWTRNWGLKNLCKDILDLDIQISAHGHNPLEDCMATREVVLWMTFLSKERFNDWADVKREQEEKRFVEETRKAKERNEKDSQERAQKEFDAAGGYDQYLRDGYGLPES